MAMAGVAEDVVLMALHVGHDQGGVKGVRDVRGYMAY